MKKMSKNVSVEIAISDDEKFCCETKCKYLDDFDGWPYGCRLYGAALDTELSGQYKKYKRCPECINDFSNLVLEKDKQKGKNAIAVCVCIINFSINQYMDRLADKAVVKYVISMQFRNMIGIAKKYDMEGCNEIIKVIQIVKVLELDVPSINEYIYENMKAATEGLRKLKSYLNQSPVPIVCMGESYGGKKDE